MTSWRRDNLKLGPLFFPMVCILFFSTQQGQTLAILGPNGAGKSTLLKALAGILPLSAGERKEGEGLKIGVFTQASKLTNMQITIGRNARTLVL